MFRTKKFIAVIVTVFVILGGCFYNCSNVASASDMSSVTYKLYPTNNIWTFLKLNTRTGEVWQLQFAVDNDAIRTQLVVNPTPLVTNFQEENGRFALYPTQNMYNFLLIDQIDGRVWQIQWSQKYENRGIIEQIQ